MTTKGTMENPSKEEEEAVDSNAVFYQYTEGCSIDRGDGNKLTVAWDDGAAIKATNGASMTYIPDHLHLHLEKQSSVYDLASDY